MRSTEDQQQLQAKMILEVRSGRATSRRILARALRLSPTTAGQYVDELIGTEILKETGLEQGPLGRPKRMLSARGEKGWFAGIEFNAERVQAVRVDFAGRQTGGAVRRLPQDADAEMVWGVFGELIELLRSGAEGPLLGIGMGVPGVVDLARGVGVEYSFLPGWREVEVTGPMEAEFKVPVTFDNNLRVIALAERWFGGGRELEDYVILGPRSGFGVAVMNGGRLIRGAHFAAGEAGRWPWPSLGGRHRVHDDLSAPGVWRRFAGVGLSARLPEDLRAALAGYANGSGSVWNEVVGDYAQFVGCVQMLLDTRVYFLHGPLTVFGKRFCDEVTEEIERRFPELGVSMPSVVVSLLGDDAGALGAASLMMEKWVPGV
jgi:predicted NBD/HSP70 family sugar kinase